jgi:hypothetical protein
MNSNDFHSHTKLRAWHLIEDLAGDLVWDCAVRIGDRLLWQITCLDMGGSNWDEQPVLALGYLSGQTITYPD